MDISIKDLITWGGILASFSGVFAALRARVSRVEEKLNTVNKVIFKERGGLSMISAEDCGKSREEFKNEIREVSVRMRCLEQNIIKIMTSMNLEPVVPERRQMTR